MRLNVLSALVVALCVPDGALAWRHLKSRYGARVRWQSPPIHFRLVDGMDGVQGAEAVRQAFALWTEPDCTGLQVMEVQPGQEVDGPVVEVRVLREWPYSPVLAAHTDVSSEHSWGWVQSATIELNGGYAFSTDDVPPEGVIDLQGLLMHEVGHALGLAHSRHSGALMRAGIDTGVVLQRQLGTDDVRAVCEVYPLDFALRVDEQLEVQPVAEDLQSRDTPPTGRRRSAWLAIPLLVWGVLAGVFVWLRSRRR